MKGNPGLHQHSFKSKFKTLDIVQSAGVDIPALLNRAGKILNKYPDIPQAQGLLEAIELLKLLK